MYLKILERNRRVRIAPFGKRAAIELAEITRQEGKPKRYGLDSIESKAKLRFDRQIVAIVRVEGQRIIYTDDNGLAPFSKQLGIESVKLNEVDPPDETVQTALDFK